MSGSCPWDGFARAADVGCEPDLCAWIVHPAEAWSNLAFIALAAVLLAGRHRSDRRLGVAWLPPIVLAIGAASFAFHASMAHWLQVLDVAAIFLFTGFLLATHLQQAGLVGPSRVPVCFALLLAGGAALSIVSVPLALLAIAAQGLAIVWLAWPRSAGRARRDLLLAITTNQLGAMALWIDKSELLCARGALAHVLQPHSLWHVLLAVSLYFFYRYERRRERARAEPAEA